MVMLKSDTYGHTKMMEQHAADIRWNVEHAVSDGGLFGMTQEQQVFGNHPETAWINLYYDGANGTSRSITLIKKIREAARQMKEAVLNGGKPSVPKELSFYLTVKEAGGSWEVEYNYNAWQTALDAKGYCSIASSENYGPETVDRLYHLRDISEKQYMIMKSQLGYSTTRVHTDEGIEGKLALCAIIPAIDAVDAVQFNQIVSGIRGYAEQGILFAGYLLSYVHMLFWSEGYRDPEKVKTMLGNCAKAADSGCISAMVLISDWLNANDKEFIPKVSKSRNEFVEIAAESHHPKAMWEYGKLCKDCAGNDLEKQAKAKYFLEMSEYYGYKPPKKEKASSGCFITSAVCGTFNKPDDCYELNVFRAFRDNWLINQSDGLSLIQEYYQIAPAIVQHIDRQANSEEIYQFIWDCYLAPCIQLIEQQHFEQCKDRYIIMVNYLKERFCNT